MIRLGLIGVGPWGRNYARTIAECPNADLMAAATRNPASRALLPAGCDMVSDWRDLVARTEIDAVIIATPPRTHADIAIAALGAGKAVLVEKPLTQSVAEAHAIARAAQLSGRPVVVGHTHLFHPGFVRLCQEVAARGPVRGIRASAGNHGPYRADVSVLWDWGPHDVAMACAALGAPPATRAASRLALSQVGGIQAERIRLQLASAAGAPVTITLSTLDDRHRWFAVDLDDATLIYADRAPSPLTLHTAPGALPEMAGHGIAVSDARPLTLLLAEFLDVLATGRASHDSLALGMSVVELLSQCEALLQDG
jgi:predicted dehydrogenase